MSELYDLDPEKFSRVESVKGRKRIYFHKSSVIIEASGNSVMPEKIPSTPYFAATNLSDDKKKRILEEVLLKLGVTLPDRIYYLQRLDPHHVECTEKQSDQDLDDLI